MKFRNLPMNKAQDSIFATIAKQGIRLWFKDSDATAVRFAVSHFSPVGDFSVFPRNIRRGRRRRFSPDYQVAHVLNHGPGIVH